MKGMCIQWGAIAGEVGDHKTDQARCKAKEGEREQKIMKNRSTFSSASSEQPSDPNSHNGMARRVTQGCIDNGRGVDVSGLGHSGKAKTDASKLESDYLITGQQSFLRRFTFSDTNSDDNINIYIPQVCIADEN